MAQRIPTKRQCAKLRALGGNGVAVVPGFGEWEALVRRGWVEAAWGDALEPKRDKAGRRIFWPPLRITPEGLRALADAVEAYGWPPSRDNSEGAAA